MLLADAHSTQLGLRAGGTEANPLMRRIAARPTLLYGVKTTAAGLNAWLLRKMSNRKWQAAVAAGTAGVYALIAASNYRIAGMPARKAWAAAGAWSLTAIMAEEARISLTATHGGARLAITRRW